MGHVKLWSSETDKLRLRLGPSGLLGGGYSLYGWVRSPKASKSREQGPSTKPSEMLSVEGKRGTL